jgi:26S proteasome regulatory subunit N2
LYALGLIHAGSPAGDKGQYLCDALRNAGTNEIVQHGACMGLGYYLRFSPYLPY